MARQLVSSESDSLSQHFKPAPGTPVSEILHRFSLQKVLSDAETLAPTLFQILQHAGGMLSTSQDQPSHKHPDLVSLTLRFYQISQNISIRFLPPRYVCFGMIMQVTFQQPCACIFLHVAPLAQFSMFSTMQGLLSHTLRPLQRSSSSEENASQ